MRSDLWNSLGIPNIHYGSRMTNNTCQNCGHNETTDIRIFGCSNCGHDGTRDPDLVWDSLHQEWTTDWQSMI
jgi:hypothetical protein